LNKFKKPSDIKKGDLEELIFLSEAKNRWTVPLRKARMYRKVVVFFNLIVSQEINAPENSLH
jgi:hypothetical protein